MKTFARKISVPLCAALVLGVSVVSSNADSQDEQAKTDGGHTKKIVHNLEVKVDKLATKLKFHAKKTADKTEVVAKKVATHVEETGHKINIAAHKTADKVGETLEKLTE